ncbi:glycine-rich domain-containing protein [Actinacidiphila glaucinigra]|uniref:glycine-rich domain-containing protein n=1 Tax=Actinacidiphila glaucinigra TaxID=235986 RepID=UPI0033DE1F0E
MGPAGPGAAPHDLEDFTASGTFTPPSDVTRVFVQVWGGGGGGGGISVLPPGLLSAGGGAGGFAWCAVPVTPGTAYTVTVGQGGPGSADANGADGTATTLSGPGGPLAEATGGAGGEVGLAPSPSAGGTGNCFANSGTTRTGAAGQPPLSLGVAGLGGRPPVNGIVEPEPQGAGTGGNGALGVLPAQDGVKGYAVIWW